MPAELDPAKRRGIGASESAAILGLHPYMTALDVYARLIGVAQDAPNEGQRRGTRAERYIADEYAEREACWNPPNPDYPLTEGKWLLDMPTQRHPEQALLIASPDRVVVRDGIVERLVEIKTARTRAGWEDPDETPDGVPPHVLIQVQHQLLVGVEWSGQHVWPDEAHVVACVGHLDDYRRYTITRSESIGKAITARVEDFWATHIEPRNPPPFDGSKAGDALLKALYPADTRPALVPAPPTAQAIMDRLKYAQAQADEWTAKADTERQIIKALCGDAAGMEGDSWRVTYKRNKDSHSTDWKAVAADLNPPEALIRQHTTTKPGPRVLRVNWRNET